MCVSWLLSVLSQISVLRSIKYVVPRRPKLNPWSCILVSAFFSFARTITLLLQLQTGGCNISPCFGCLGSSFVLLKPLHTTRLNNANLHFSSACFGVDRTYGDSDSAVMQHVLCVVHICTRHSVAYGFVCDRYRICDKCLRKHDCSLIKQNNLIKNQTRELPGLLLHTTAHSFFFFFCRSIAFKIECASKRRKESYWFYVQN